MKSQLAVDQKMPEITVVFSIFTGSAHPYFQELKLVLFSSAYLHSVHMLLCVYFSSTVTEHL